MKNALSNLMNLAIVALPMMIALSVFASAQSVSASATGVRGRVMGGIITIVKKSGAAIQSYDGGKNWQTLDTTNSQDVASDLQQAIAKRQRLLAEVAGTANSHMIAVNDEVAQSGRNGANSTASGVAELPNQVVVANSTGTR